MANANATLKPQKAPVSDFVRKKNHPCWKKSFKNINIIIVGKLLNKSKPTLSDIDELIIKTEKELQAAIADRNLGIDKAKRNLLPYVRDIVVMTAHVVCRGRTASLECVLSIAKKARRRFVFLQAFYGESIARRRKRGRKPKFSSTLFFIRKRLRSEATRVMFGYLKKGNIDRAEFEKTFGYDPEKLRKKLIRGIPNGYSWSDFLSARLHLDHIIPISVFNFASKDDIDFRRAWHYTNLQLLPASENLKKSDKLIAPFQPSLAF